MALDYAACAKEIYETLDGRENLVSAAHCATRLRLVTVDNSKIDMKKLESIEGVKGVFSSNGQLQMIIGTGTVNKVYDEFLKVSGMTAATKDDVKAAAAKSMPLHQRLVKSLGDVFVPILPAIVASGLKTIAIPSALSAALGITEPAIFGVNLRYVKPLVCGMVGGAIGAWFGSIMGIGATAYGVTGIPGFLIVSDHILPYAVMLLISGGVAFALTWVFWKEEAAEEPAQAKTTV